jgi:hypothetical protein
MDSVLRLGWMGRSGYGEACEGGELAGSWADGDGNGEQG